MYELELSTLGRDLAIDVVALFLLAYVIHYRRHRRRELLIGYVAFNLSLFLVAAALVATNALTVGVGFGLFAVLSIVRLRSDESTQSEVGFTMVALVLGLLTGLPGIDVAHKVVFAAVLVLAMFIVDHPKLVPAARHQTATIQLDVVELVPRQLERLLADRLGGRIVDHRVREVDYVRETMTVDVTWRLDEEQRTGEPGAVQPGPARR